MDGLWCEFRSSGLILKVWVVCVMVADCLSCGSKFYGSILAALMAVGEKCLLVDDGGKSRIIFLVS